nr:MAG TPA: hypothetical protein [Caudoviricetes sp.]
MIVPYFCIIIYVGRILPADSDSSDCHQIR